jgi:hypothetical protein
MADTEFSNKLSAALRYGATTAGTGFTLLAVLSLLTPEQVVALKANVETLKTSILTGYGALVNMWAILGPVAIGVAVKMGWSSSSVQAMAGKLLKIAGNQADPDKATEAKVAIVNAAASPAVGSQGVVNKELAANPATSENVVASASDVPAKAAA